MIARRVRARSGITLTEILISILIMGIGMISLAVLFPLGLLKLREAARLHRSGLLAQAVSDDLETRGLLNKELFTRTWYGPRDPFTLDQTLGNFAPVQSVGAQPGLMICYDPFWRAFTQIVPPNPNTNNALYDGTLVYDNTNAPAAQEVRFGAAIVGSTNVFSLRSGSQDGNGSPTLPSAYGLQRITDFIPLNNKKLTGFYPFTYLPQGTGVVADTCISPDDILFNTTDNGAGGLSPLLPDLSVGNAPQADYKYSWFFTGRQVDSTNGTLFQGDVVVCDSRPFTMTNLPGQTTPVPAGETVVEAIFGYSESVSAKGFSVGADRTVLLRWQAGVIPDPTIRVGGWIADVTYERFAANSAAKLNATQTSFQRCHWYQITKKSDPQDDPDLGNQYRRMIVTISSPVKTKTYLAAKGVPVFANAALIMPSVINVYPRAFSQ